MLNHIMFIHLNSYYVKYYAYLYSVKLMYNTLIVKVMRLTKSEKELLFKLTDVMSERVLGPSIYHFDNEHDKKQLYAIFLKLRLDLLGY